MKEKLVILTGPTGVGKTSISLGLARELNGEIISADSMQIYRNLDIGTAKIREDEMENIPHHLLSIVDPREYFSVADFKDLAVEKIHEINSRGKIPIVVGGTGLYINSLVYNLDFHKTKANLEYREYLEKLLEEKGLKFLYELLLEKDPEAASNTDSTNPNRVIRALEIVESGGKKFVEKLRDENKDYDLLMIGLTQDREKLYEKINLRVDKMFEEGLLEEVKSVLEYTPKDAQSLKAIGYRELIDYLEGSTDFNRAVELIKQHSRNYAKRQLTWFRRDERIKWFDIDLESREDILNYARSYYGI